MRAMLYPIATLGLIMCVAALLNLERVQQNIDFSNIIVLSSQPSPPSTAPFPPPAEDRPVDVTVFAPGSPSASASETKLREYLKGRKAVLVQVDNRLSWIWKDFARDSDAVAPPYAFTGRHHVGASVLAVARWAQSQNLGYLYFDAAPGKCYGPYGDKEANLEFFPVAGWCKVPGILYIHRLLQRAAGVDALVYLDSDVAPDVVAQNPTHGEILSKQSRPFTYDDFLASEEKSSGKPFVDSPRHMLLATSKGFWKSTLDSMKVYENPRGINNAGGILTRVTPKGWELLRHWWFNSTRMVAPFDVYFTKFKLRLKDTMSKSAADEANKRLQAYLSLKSLRYEFADGPSSAYTIRGFNNQTIMQRAYDDLCGSNKAAFLATLSEGERVESTCEGFPDFPGSSTIFNWPGDQGRLQWMMEEDASISVPLNPALAAEDTGEPKLFYHWSKRKEIKTEMAALWSPKLHRETPGGEAYTFEEWETRRAWQAVLREVPRITFPAHLASAGTDDAIREVVDTGNFEFYAP